MYSEGEISDKEAETRFDDLLKTVPDFPEIRQAVNNSVKAIRDDIERKKTALLNQVESQLDTLISEGNLRQATSEIAKKNGAITTALSATRL